MRKLLLISAIFIFINTGCASAPTTNKYNVQYSSEATEEKFKQEKIRKANADQYTTHMEALGVVCRTTIDSVRLGCLSRGIERIIEDRSLILGMFGAGGYNAAIKFTNQMKNNVEILNEQSKIWKLYETEQLSVYERESLLNQIELKYSTK